MHTDNANAVQIGPIPDTFHNPQQSDRKAVVHEGTEPINLRTASEIEAERKAAKRVFSTGATRDTVAGKIDYEGHLSVLALEAYGTYMDYNRLMKDGSARPSDNWQLGIPRDQYMKSGLRHMFDWWKYHRGFSIKENIVWALCGVLFNASGYLHELLKNDPTLLVESLQHMEAERAKARSKA